MENEDKLQPLRDLIQNTTFTREVRLRIEASRAPKKRYGANVFRVGRSAYLLENREWTMVKKAREYSYLRPPELDSPPFQITVKIPTREQVTVIANVAHRIGLPVEIQFSETGFLYMPERRYTTTPVDPFTGVEGPTEAGGTIGPTFVAICGDWKATVDLRNGTESYHEQDACVLPSSEPGQLQLPPQSHSDFFEGALLRTERNVYERDRAARATCIGHHGAVCKACGMDLAKRYGAVAEGFIHVHHRRPVASIGENYAVDPINDLVPVCPTCHGVMHLREPPYTVEEIMEFLSSTG